MTELTAGIRFKQAVKEESPLQIVGVINAYAALLAQRTGFKALYLSGAGVANASYGIPDLGMTNLNDVLEDVRRVTAASDLPLLVDVDTGWGHAFGIARTVREMIRAGAAAIHIEDQVAAKRCGHRLGKATVKPQEMVDRIKAAVDAKTCADFVIMARTDALESEGFSSTVDRVSLYIEAGAEMIFLEAVTDPLQYEQFTKVIKAPVLANMTEFGKTPLLTLQQLKALGVAIVLYPLSAFRAMNAAALNIFQTIRTQGSQESVVNLMQTRAELYEVLDYYRYENYLDQFLSATNKES